MMLSCSSCGKQAKNQDRPSEKSTFCSTCLSEKVPSAFPVSLPLFRGSGNESVAAKFASEGYRVISTRIGPIISRRGQGRRQFARPAAQADQRRLRNERGQLSQGSRSNQSTQGAKDPQLDPGVQTRPDTTEQEAVERVAVLRGAPENCSPAMGPRATGKESKAVARSPRVTQNVGWHSQIAALERAVLERYEYMLKEATEEVQQRIRNEKRATIGVNAVIGALAAKGVPEHMDLAEYSQPRDEGAQMLQLIFRADPAELEKARDALKKYHEDERKNAEEKLEGLKKERRVALIEVNNLRKHLEGLPGMNRRARTASKRTRAGGSGVVDVPRVKRTRVVVGEHEEVLDGSGPMDDGDQEDAEEE